MLRIVAEATTDPNHLQRSVKMFEERNDFDAAVVGAKTLLDRYPFNGLYLEDLARVASKSTNLKLALDTWAQLYLRHPYQAQFCVALHAHQFGTEADSYLSLHIADISTFRNHTGYDLTPFGFCQMSEWSHIRFHRFPQSMSLSELHVELGREIPNRFRLWLVARRLNETMRPFAVLPNTPEQCIFALFLSL